MPPKKTFSRTDFMFRQLRTHGSVVWPWQVSWNRSFLDLTAYSQSIKQWIKRLNWCILCFYFFTVCILIICSVFDDFLVFGTFPGLKLFVFWGRTIGSWRHRSQLSEAQLSGAEFAQNPQMESIPWPFENHNLSKFICLLFLEYDGI